MEAYEKALSNSEPVQLGAKRTLAGSIDAAAIAYYETQAFKGLAPATRQTRRAILERFRADHGARSVALMDTRALQAIIAKKTPSSQRGFKKALRGLVDHCIEKGWIKIDPLLGLKFTR
jgi:hypothetical protein